MPQLNHIIIIRVSLIEDSKLLIITEPIRNNPITISFDLTKDFDINMKIEGATQICSLLITKIRIKDSNKHDAFQNYSIYYTWKNVKEHYKSNKL